MNDNQNLISAVNEHGRSIPIHDDGSGKLWAYGHEYGIVRIIRADSYESAYGIAVDESPTIEPDELHEAYGFYLMQACRWCDVKSKAPFYVLSDHDEHGEMVSEKTLVCNGDRRSIADAPTKKEALALAKAYISEHEMDVIEGYSQQDNASGTGIVNVGDYEWLREITETELKEKYEITLTVETDE